MGAPVYNAVPSDFASRIKQLRQKYGLTQANLAEHLGVSYVTVNRWENEVARLSARHWRQITKTELLGYAALSHDSDAALIVREEGPSYQVAAGRPLLGSLLIGAEQILMAAEEG